MSDAHTLIHRYEIVERLGQGGMGELYLAKDPLLDRFVAIKVLRAGLDSGELRERFAREARSAARLAHINIVTIYDVGDHNGQPYIAMEYVQGETLHQMIRRLTELPLGTKLQYVDEICAGLAHAHKSGIVHRDIKPANLMVAADGTLKVLDFGIARLADSSMTQSGMVLGTLNYMSPEQITGQEVDHRSDIFAVGAVFYELLSYHQAFPGGIDSGVLTRIISGTPVSLEQLCPGIDVRLVRVIDRALAKAPADRYPDLVAMRSELALVRERLDQSVLTSPVTTSITVKKAPAPDSRQGLTPKTPRRGTNREELKRRRAEEVAGHLANARNAFAAGRMEEASAACERVLIIEPDHEEATDLSERARAGIEQQQIREWMIEARGELDRGNLDGARQILSSIASLDEDGDEARALRTAIAQIEARRMADEAVVSGRAALEDGDASSASHAAREALRAHPTHTGAAALLRDAGLLVEEQRRRAEHNRRASEVVENARLCFTAGEMDAAIALLEEFSPPHHDVAAALEELRADAREIREREFAREQQAAGEVVIARAWLARDDLDQAASAIDRARALSPHHRDAADVAQAIDVRRAEIEARRRAEEQARQRAADEEARRKAAEQARARAEEQARQRAADEARRREEEDARRKADEQARLRAEEEARQLAAEAARKKAEADARKKAAEQAQRRAEQEARKKAAEEARQRAEEDARRQAAEDAQRKAAAEQDARRKAAAEAEQRAQAAKRAEDEARQRAADQARQRAEEDARRKAAEEAQRKAAAEEDARRKAAAEAEQRKAASAAATVIQPKRKPPDETTLLTPVKPAPQPDLSTQAPAPTTRAGAGARQVMPLAAAAVIAVALIGFGLWRFTSGGDVVVENSPPLVADTPQAGEAPQPSGAPQVSAGAATAQTPTEQTTPQVDATTGTLVVDAAPWAEIVEIVGTAGRVSIRASHTPMAVALSEGEYRVTLRNPSDSAPRTLTVRVVAGRDVRAFAEFKPIDVDEYFRRAGS